MKIINICLYVIISITFLGCYSVEHISYNHEHNDEIKNYTYNGIWDMNVLPYYHNDKVFLINLSSEIYFNVPSDNKYNYFTIFLNIFSKEVINNIIINNCEIEFNDYILKFEKSDLKYYSNQSNNKDSNFINYEIIFSKRIDKNDYNKNVKNVIKNSSEQNYISVKIDINYTENGVVINYENTTRLNPIFYRNWYTPKNLWGWLGVETSYE